MRIQTIKRISILLSLVVSVSVFLNGCAAQTPVQEPDAEQTAAYRQDFYEAVNREWLATAKIPEGKMSTGAFAELTQQNEQRNLEILQVLADGTHKEGSAQQKLADFYKSAMDTTSRNQAGTTPIQKYLVAYSNAGTVAELLQADLLAYQEIGIMQLFSASVYADEKNSSQMALHLSALEPTLQQEQYSSESVIGAYEQYLTTCFTLSGESAEQATAAAKQVIDLEKELAKSQMKSEDAYDISKSYHEYSVKKMQSWFPKVDAATLLLQMGYGNVERMIIEDEVLFQKAAGYFIDANVPVLKQYAKASLLLTLAPYLSDTFSAAQEAFQQSVYGVQGSLSAEQKALHATERYLPDYLGQLYVEKFFDESTKQDIEGMIQEFLSVYEKKIRAADWMSEATKEKAIRKLKTLQIQVGYPNEWQDTLQQVPILGAEAGQNHLLTNVFELEKAINRIDREKLSKPVDKTEWSMPVFTANAAYMPSKNTIVFPAGILQAPFYDKAAPKAQNLGAIGAVIAHEISHAFDSAGSQYDENGNAVDWWLPEDHQRFSERCKKIIAAYDGIEVSDGVQNDGKLTLIENIADLGGVSCSLAVLSKEEAPDYATFFKAWAGLWKESITPEGLQYYSTVDIHSRNKVRANRTLSNFEEFYEAFGIEEGDGMYIPPEERVSLW